MKRRHVRLLKAAAIITGALYIPGLTGCAQVFQANIEALLRPGVIQTGFFFPFTLISRIFGGW